MTKIMATLLALLLVWSLPNITIASEDIVSLMGDRQYWEAFQWDKAENSTIWTLQGWGNFTERDDRNRQTFVKRRTVSILGIDFIASQLKKDLPAQLPWVLGMYTLNKSAEQCEQIASWGTSKFGKPNILDGSYEIIFGPNPDSQLDMAQKFYEWVIGSTRIVVSCLGLEPRVPKDSGPSLVIQLLIAHLTTEKPVTPLFALKCTETITPMADPSMNKIALSTFFVDAYMGQVRNLKKVPFGTQTPSHQIESHLPLREMTWSLTAVLTD